MATPEVPSLKEQLRDATERMCRAVNDSNLGEARKWLAEVDRISFEIVVAELPIPTWKEMNK